MNANPRWPQQPVGSKLNAIFSSDIGHFDVIDMRRPLREAYELVEDGHIAADDFRVFTFSYAVKLWSTQNPHFFEGTRVAKQAAAVLAAAQTPPAPQRRSCTWRCITSEGGPAPRALSTQIELPTSTP